MGCPSMFYKMALNNLCHALIANNETIEKAKAYYNEKHSEEELEEKVRWYIHSVLSPYNYNMNKFYYLAGKANMYTMNEADEMGIDAFNASLGGLKMFEDFIFEAGDE